MDFSFTEVQTLLRNSVSRFVQDNYDMETRREIVSSDEGMRDDYWQTFAELGLLGAPFPEDFGGLGGSAIDTMVVMEEFGKGLVIEPYIPTVVQCGGLLVQGGTDEQKASLIPQIVEGSLKLAFAFAEPQGRYALSNIATRAETSGNDFVLNGQKSVVIGAPWADKFVVSARTGGEQNDDTGISLFLVDKSADGLTRRDYPTIDGLRASDLTFQQVTVSADSVVGNIDEALPLIEQAIDVGIAAICAEAIGCMKVLNDTTVEYCKTRKQFGVPIGKFQVLQHCMVDMFMEYEQSVSMAYMVNMKLGADASERKKAASAAKVQIGTSGRFITQNAIQLHGGMGMTDELNVGQYAKRLTMIEPMFGDVDHHLKRYGSLA